MCVEGRDVGCSVKGRNFGPYSNFSSPRHSHLARLSQEFAAFPEVLLLTLVVVGPFRCAVSLKTARATPYSSLALGLLEIPDVRCGGALKYHPYSLRDCQGCRLISLTSRCWRVRGLGRPCSAVSCCPTERQTTRGPLQNIIRSVGVAEGVNMLSIRGKVLFCLVLAPEGGESIETSVPTRSEELCPRDNM